MGLFSGGTETSKQPYEKNPWEPQQPYLTAGFSNSVSALEEAKATNDQIQDPVADLSPNQKKAMDLLYSRGVGNSNDAGAAINRLAGNGSEAMGDYLDNAEGILSEAGQDRTGTIISNAEQYADNPYLDSQIDAALGDVRSAFDRDKASINNAASTSGNMNSTRAGAMEARALDDAMDRGADISSSMRGAAYEGGLSMAANQEGARISDMMTANNAYGGAAAKNFDTMLGAMKAENDALSSIYNVGNIQQDQAQSEIDGKMAQGSRDLDLMGQYMSTIGGSYGGEGYTTKTYKTQSPFQTLLGGAATLGGLGWSPFG